MADEGEEGDDGKGEYVAPPRWMRPRSAPAKPRETPESPATTRPGSASSIRRAKAARAKNERLLKRNGSDYGVRCGSGSGACGGLLLRPSIISCNFSVGPADTHASSPQPHIVAPQHREAPRTAPTPMMVLQAGRSAPPGAFPVFHSRGTSVPNAAGWGQSVWPSGLDQRNHRARLVRPTAGWNQEQAAVRIEPPLERARRALDVRGPVQEAGSPESAATRSRNPLALAPPSRSPQQPHRRPTRVELSAAARGASSANSGPSQPRQANLTSTGPADNYVSMRSALNVPSGTPMWRPQSAPSNIRQAQAACARHYYPHSPTTLRAAQVVGANPTVAACVHQQQQQQQQAAACAAAAAATTSSASPTRGEGMVCFTIPSPRMGVGQLVRNGIGANALKTDVVSRSPTPKVPASSPRPGDRVIL